MATCKHISPKMCETTDKCAGLNQMDLQNQVVKNRDSNLKRETWRNTKSVRLLICKKWKAQELSTSA